MFSQWADGEQRGTNSAGSTVPSKVASGAFSTEGPTRREHSSASVTSTCRTAAAFTEGPTSRR